MNKLATAFKFGTVALLLAAIVQCSSVTTDAEGKIHGVKDVSQDAEQDATQGPAEGASQENTEGNTVATRFNVPNGYTRKSYAAGTFGNYLQQLPLKPAGTLTKRYNGETKPN